MKTRSFFSLIHRYSGLLLLLLVVIASVSGSLLTFGPELDRMLNPALLQVSPPMRDAAHRSLTEQLASAVAYQRQLDDGPWQSVSITPAQRIDGVSSIFFRHPNPEIPGKFIWRQILINPYDASALGHRERSQLDIGRTGIIHLLSEIHGKLLLGDAGRWIMGIAALLWTLTTLIGLYLWWPGRHKLALALSVKRNAGPARFNFDLHRAIGFYSAPVLLLIAFSGIYMALPAEVKPLVAAVSSLEAGTAPHLQTPGQGTALPPDAAVNIAKAVFPAGELKRIGLPRSNTEPYAISFLLPDEVRRPSSGRSVVWIDPYRGGILKSYDATTGSAGEHFLNWQTPLHTGTAFGLTGRILVAISGIAAAILALVGLLVWQRKQSKSQGRVFARTSNSQQKLKENI